MKVGFFFGAGAECECFGLPSGSEYVIRTILIKNSSLYEELEKFYNKRCSVSYIEKYRKDFLFKKGSHTFGEIIDRAAEEYSKLNCADKTDEHIEEYLKALRRVYQNSDNKEKSWKTLEIINNDSDDKKLIEGFRNEMYNALVKELVEGKDMNSTEEFKYTNNETIESISEHLSYYGAIEKDFSTIIDPCRAGIIRFWRLINYFWNAYFTILEPLCKGFEWYKDIKDDRKKFYKTILSDLPTKITEIIKDYDYESVDVNQENYYKNISEAFGNSFPVLTTNYTPFAEHYFGSDNCIYLAGKISDFEFPTELTVKDVRSCGLSDTDFIFPFLMTQAPVKPIIVPTQIIEYAKAIEKLQEIDTLIIIGYSFCEMDNHINAMLHQFALKNDKRIVYCYYSKNSKSNTDMEKESVLKKLKLMGLVKNENIVIVKNDGEADKLVKILKEYI